MIHFMASLHSMSIASLASTYKRQLIYSRDTTYRYALPVYALLLLIHLKLEDVKGGTFIEEICLPVFTGSALKGVESVGAAIIYDLVKLARVSAIVPALGLGSIFII